MPENEYEKAARMAKATKICDVIAATKVTAAEIEQGMLDEPELVAEMWLAAAAQAHVPPPSDTTKALVLQFLRNREKADHEARWRYARKER